MTAMPPSQASAPRAPGWVWFALPMLVAAWLRLRGIGDPEAFVDEGANILTAIDPRVRLAFEPLEQGRPWLVHLFAPATWFPAHTLTLARIMTAASGLATIAAIGWTLHRLAGRAAALGGAWLWAVMPIAVFHERLALQDPFVAALIAWGVALITAGAFAREGGRTALAGFALAGVLFGSAFMLKISALFALPWLVITGWAIQRRAGRPALEWRHSAIALGAMLPVLTLGTDIFRLGRGLGRYQALASFHGRAPFSDFLFRLEEWLRWYAGYGDWPLLALLLAALWAAVRLRQRAALACLAAWVVAVLVSGVFYHNLYARYLVPDHLPLVLFLALAWGGLADAAGRLRPLVWGGFGVMLGGWGVTAWQIGTSPTRAPVPEQDIAQYFTGAWSGNGLDQVQRYLTARAEHAQERCLVLTHRFLRPGCYGLMLRARAEPRLGVVPLTIYEPAELDAARAELRKATAGQRVRFFLLYEGSMYPAHPWLDAPGSGARRVLETPHGPGEKFTLYEFELERGK